MTHSNKTAERTILTAPTPLVLCGFATFAWKRKKAGDYYDGLIYSYYDKDFLGEPLDPEQVYITVTGGYDHMYMSLFAYRCFLLPDDSHWIYSSRVCLR